MKAPRLPCFRILFYDFLSDTMRCREPENSIYMLFDRIDGSVISGVT